MIFTTTVLSPGQSSLPLPPSISPFDAHPPTSAGDSLVCRARASTPASQNTPTETQRPPAPRKCCTLATAVPDPQRSTHNAPSLSLAAALEAAPPPTEAHPAAHISTHPPPPFFLHSFPVAWSSVLNLPPAVAQPVMKISDAVWLRSEGKNVDGPPFVLGSITNVQQGGARLTVRRPDGTEGTFDNRSADVFRANPKGQVAPDHCALIHLNEPCVLDNSKERYIKGDIYTYTGKILVALNPFEVLPIYGHAPPLPLPSLPLFSSSLPSHTLPVLTSTACSPRPHPPPNDARTAPSPHPSSGRQPPHPRSPPLAHAHTTTARHPARSPPKPSPPNEPPSSCAHVPTMSRDAASRTWADLLTRTSVPKARSLTSTRWARSRSST